MSKKYKKWSKIYKQTAIKNKILTGVIAKTSDDSTNSHNAWELRIFTSIVEHFQMNANKS